MPLLPSRRWLQFSVRTLLVIVAVFTVVAVWLVWQLHIVNTRVAMEERLHGADTFFDRDMPHVVDKIQTPTYATIPIWRTWLGDAAIHSICISSKTPRQEIEKLRTCFPEAEIIVDHGATIIEATNRCSAFCF